MADEFPIIVVPEADYDLSENEQWELSTSSGSLTIRI